MKSLPINLSYLNYSRSFLKSIYLTFALLLTMPGLYAQDLESILESLPESAAQKFAQPLVNAVGAGLNTGWMTKAPNATISGLNVRFGLVGMGAFINGEEDIFRLIGTVFQFQESEAREIAASIDGYNNLTSAQQEALIRKIVETEFIAEVTGPTIFGSEDSQLSVETDAQTVKVDGVTYNIDPQDLTFDDITGLWDQGVFPTAAPQLSVGTVYGTQITLRYLPSISLSDEIGSLKYFGYGIQHNPAVWLTNPLPVDIGLSFFTQKIKIEDVLEVNTTAFGAQVSKTFGSGILGITPYAGFLVESSDMAVDYTYELLPGVDANIQFDLEGENKSRFILGSGFNIVGLNIFADYNFSAVNSANLSIMYSF